MIRFAIVGTGRISDWILKGALEVPGFKAAAVCSRSAEHARAFIGRHPEAFDGDALVFTDIDEMAACPAIDAVYIGTPNTTHCDYTLRCLSKGKAVLCEKPLACSTPEVLEMVGAARKYGVLLMEAMISTLNPNFLKVKEMLKEIGPVRHYHSGFCQYSSKYDALRKGVVASSFNPLMGGGALADIGVYTTYPMIALFGAPESVESHKVMFPTEYGPVDIQGSAVVKYPDMTASLTYSKVVDSLLPTEICAEGGNILLDAIHICRHVEWAPHAAPTSGRGPQAGRMVIADGLGHDEYFYEFEEFIRLMEAGKTESSINSLDVSLANRRLMDTIQKA